MSCGVLFGKKNCSSEIKKQRLLTAVFSKIFSPSIQTSPSSGSRMPAIMRRNVDLPAPFEPIRP